MNWLVRPPSILLFHFSHICPALLIHITLYRWFSPKRLMLYMHMTLKRLVLHVLFLLFLSAVEPTTVSSLLCRQIAIINTIIFLKVSIYIYNLESLMKNWIYPLPLCVFYLYLVKLYLNVCTGPSVTLKIIQGIVRNLDTLWFICTCCYHVMGPRVSHRDFSYSWTYCYCGPFRIFIF